MPQNKPQNITFRWCTHFVQTLYNEGLRKVVISPGSRSTPLTLAFAAHPGFDKTVVLDERSAAFIALGQAKATGIPSVLVCTSGTALANYTPAVFEAGNCGTPLIVGSADRPPHQRGIGASQTIDQIKIFANSTVFFHEAGEPSSKRENLDRLKAAAKQAVRSSIQKSGVSHINFPFDKPLEPEIEFLKKIEDENRSLINNSDSARNPGLKFEASSLDKSVREALSAAKRPVVIAGPANHFEVNSTSVQLAEFLDAPLLAEPGSGLGRSTNHISGYAGFLRNEKNAEKLEPDLILRFGAFPVNNALQQYLKKYRDVAQIAFCHPNLWQDGDVIPHQRVFLPIKVELNHKNKHKSAEWLHSWKDIENQFQSFKKQAISSNELLSDGFVFKTLGKLLPEDGFTMLSNSFPVRDYALFCEKPAGEVYVNRGAAGIDGIISTTIGISNSSRKKGVLFIGDLAFLHDSNALLSKKVIGNALIIVVLNNGGGNIFKMLPIAEHADTFERYFLTPQHADIQLLCQAHGIPHTSITKPGQLVEAFRLAEKKEGIQVLECFTDSEKSMRQRQTLWSFQAGSPES